ncbi:MAG: CesT family type III secretion system chaperone [Chlamydiales bacterium]|nr:CesT family type III secretion system chaperone [Chlamydiales bacterium]
MSLENAKQNLREFGKELNLEGLNFDENNTCILGIDNTFSLHLTYEPNSDRLYLYSPILDGLPKDSDTKLKLYEALMEGSMLGGQMAGGGVGLAVREELILMHAVLEMGSGTDPNSLRRFAPLFVEAVEKWRAKAKDLIEGRENFVPRDWGASPEQHMAQEHQSKPHRKDDGFQPGDRFTKV